MIYAPSRETVEQTRLARPRWRAVPGADRRGVPRRSKTLASLPSEASRTFAERQPWLRQRREGAAVRLCALVP